MKRKNPLYVVSQKGNVVEEASGSLDFIVKRLGLAPLINMIKSLFEKLVSMVQNYATLIGVREIIDNISENIEVLVNQLKSRFA